MKRDRRIAVAAALVTLAIHLIANPHYGFFRDELYFIVCGFHPAWGYVDQPPVVPLLDAGSQLFGHSLFLLRAIPALFAAAGAYVTCALVLELGGSAFAQLLAIVAYLSASVLTTFGQMAIPDMVGLWLWPLAALYAVRIVNGAGARWWLAVGAAVGVSLESKYSVVFFAAALVAGLLLTPQRRILATPWFAAGAALALAIALPNFLWQAAHGFPMWELLRNGQNGKNVVVGPGVFIFQQFLATNLFLAPVWIVGWIWLLREPTYRFLGYTYALLIAIMIALHAKYYYPVDVYPIVIAAGGVVFEGWTRRWPQVRVALVAVAVAAGLVFLPFSLPILSERAMVRYAAFVGRALHLSKSALATEHHRTALLPPNWADMHGWPGLAATVARVYDSLPPAQRAHAAIVASNYGEAAAIDFFGRSDGLPPALSGHNNYWLWGTHGYSGEIVIDVGGDCFRRDAPGLFRNARLVTHVDEPWAISYEQNLPISLCTGITKPLAQAWPNLRFYI